MIKNNSSDAKSTDQREKLLAFADKTLGIWADDVKIEQAFEELERRWQQWRDEMLFRIHQS